MKSALIVEDIPETLEWLEGILHSSYPECHIDEASNVRQALRAIKMNHYDLALIDLGLPDGSGLDVLHQLTQHCPETVCVITTVMGDDAHVVAALSAGAQGYLLKEQSPELLVHQLTQLASGIPALSPSIARRIMQHFQLTGPSLSSDNTLSTREQQVLSLISSGLCNREVAQTLGIAASTIASHIKVIYRKLGISSRAEAALHATRLGLVRDNPDYKKK